MPHEYHIPVQDLLEPRVLSLIFATEPGAGVVIGALSPTSRDERLSFFSPYANVSIFQTCWVTLVIRPALPLPAT